VPDVPRARGHLTRLLAAGGALALLAHVLPDARSASSDAAHAIVLDAARVRSVERAWIATTGRTPAADERAALVGAEVDDEILYREALALGLDGRDVVVQHRIAGNLSFVEDGPPPGTGPDGALARDMLREDVVVRRRLVDRMRARLEQTALADEPRDDELARALAANAERFRLPARVRIAVAPADGDGAGERGATARPDAAAVRELPAQSERDLARVYGASFAREVLQASPGAWTAPIAATSGRWHVMVHEHEPPRMPPLADVRNRVRDLVRREHAAAAVRRALDELRRGYEVSFTGDPADRPG
jgi:peptidyl-prolyl cis-trans isomerase C